MKSSRFFCFSGFGERKDGKEGIIMGVWLSAKGRLEVVPQPDDELLIDFWIFSRYSWPEDYERMDERFTNTWFFDENNRLACTAGKFAEPCVWHDWMKEHFFTPRGYELVGDIEIIGEEDPEIFNEVVLKEYYAWKERVSNLMEERRSMSER